MAARSDLLGHSLENFDAVPALDKALNATQGKIKGKPKKKCGFSDLVELIV